MERRLYLIFVSVIACVIQSVQSGETVLSNVLTPTTENKLNRQSRSYYDYRYGIPRPYDRLEYARLEYDRPRCGRCDDRYDDDDDRRRDRDDDRHRDRDDDRHQKPTYGSRYDRNRNTDSEEDDKRYSDRKNNQRNGTDEDSGDKKKHDDKDRRRDRDRDRNRNRYDDRDRYRPDYYDRFLRDRERDYYDRYYDDFYRSRRPTYERYPYDRYDEGYPRYDGYRKPYDGRYDDAFGGYGPSAGRGAHDSFRPWDETYRGQAGWDAGGRGYYFASGRPESTPSQAWGRPEYARPQSESGWQNVGYAGGYRDPLEYRGSLGYGQNTGYRQDINAGYGQASGWQSVGERRPYRDQSGVSHLDNRPTDRDNQASYGQGNRVGSYAQTRNYGQPNGYQNGNSNYGQSSTTPVTSYLFQREDEQVTSKLVEDTTKTPS